VEGRLPATPELSLANRTAKFFLINSLSSKRLIVCAKFNFFMCTSVLWHSEQIQNEILAADHGGAALASTVFWWDGCAHRGTCSLRWVHTLKKQPTDIYSVWYQSLWGLHGFGPKATFLPKESTIRFSLSVHKNGQLPTSFRLLPSPRI